MNTIVFHPESDPAAIQEAAAILRRGGLLGIPTETVYGLGADALNEDAVVRIFLAKGRPQDNPLIIHVPDASWLEQYCRDVPPEAYRLAERFWPGPLTMILPRRDIVPLQTTGGLETVGVRCPDHPVTLAIIRAAGVPIAAPSANLSGRPSPTTAQHVKADLEGRIDLILDGGPCRVGLESTVLSLCGTPTILRPGGVTREMLEAVMGSVQVSSAVLAPLKGDGAAPSPGMKYKHYAPNAQVRIAGGSPRQAAENICTAYDIASLEGKTCMIFATRQTQAFYRQRKYVIIGDREDPATLCASLFSALRQYGDDVDLVLCEALPQQEMGLAYMNRLLRAAGFQWLEEA